MKRRIALPALFFFLIACVQLSFPQTHPTLRRASAPTSPTATAALTTSTAASSMWITAYYTVWGACGLPPQNIDYTSVTHIVHQAIEPTANGAYAGRWWKFPTAFHEDDTLYFEQGVGTGCPASPVQRTLIDMAHANGVKVLLGLGANESDYAAIAADPVMLQQYVASVLGYARNRGYDGVDVDWEFVRSSTRQAFINLVTALKDTLETWSPAGLLSVAVPGWYNVNNDVATMNARVDQINLMTYDMAGYWDAVSGFNAALHDPQISGYVAANADSWVGGWLGAGLNPGKTGFGVPFYGLSWEGVDGPAQSGWTHESQVSYDWAMNMATAGSMQWQSNALVPYLSIPNSGGKKYFISYDDSLSLTRKVEYARTKGLGGVMIFELWRGLLNGRQPLLEAVRAAAWGNGGPTGGGGQIAVTPAALNFGQVRVNTTRLDSVTVTNPASVATTVAISASSPAFAALAPQTFTLAPGAVQVVRIAFTPVQKQSYSATLSLASSAGGSQTVALSGSGVMGARARRSLSGINFGTVLVGSAKIDSFTVYNTGDMNLDVAQMQSSNLVFGVNPPTASIAPSDSMNFYVTAQPDSAQYEAGMINQIDNSVVPLDPLVVQSAGLLTTGVGGSGIPPLSFALDQNYPNPFNPSTVISYTLPERSAVTLIVYTMLGEEVARLVDREEEAGAYTVPWNAAGGATGSLATGVYTYRLSAAATASGKISIATRKMMLVR